MEERGALENSVAISNALLIQRKERLPAKAKQNKMKQIKTPHDLGSGQY